MRVINNGNGIYCFEIESEEDSRAYGNSFFDARGARELYLPEGILTLQNEALTSCPGLRVLHLPHSLTSLACILTTREREALIVEYPGTAAEFEAISAPRQEEIYTPGPFDRSPYYSDHGASLDTVEISFDKNFGEIEVRCTDTTLWYGKKNRKEGQRPLTDADRKARLEAEAEHYRKCLARICKILSDGEGCSIIYTEDGEARAEKITENIRLDGDTVLFDCTCCGFIEGVKDGRIAHTKASATDKRYGQPLLIYFTPIPEGERTVRMKIDNAIYAGRISPFRLTDFI